MESNDIVFIVTEETLRTILQEQLIDNAVNCDEDEIARRLSRVPVYLEQMRYNEFAADKYEDYMRGLANDLINDTTV